MAHFPADPAVAGILSAADKTKLDTLSSLASGDAILYETYQIFPIPKESGAVTEASSSSSSYETKARFLLVRDKFTRTGCTFVGKLYVRGMVSAAGKNGDVRIFNVTDATELGVINFTELTFTLKTVDMSSLPASGNKEIEIQFRKNTTGTTLSVDLLTIEFAAQKT